MHASRVARVAENLRRMNLKQALISAQQLADYEESVRQYFLRASGGKSDRGWTPRCRFAISKKPRYELEAFLKKAGFMTKQGPAQ